MSEWSIEHAWKLTPAARADAHQIAPTHSRSTTSRNNDLLQRVAVNDGAAPGFRGVCDTVLTQSANPLTSTHTNTHHVTRCEHVIHDITTTQVVVDAPHKDLRRARASSLSLIPTSTRSATAIALIYPDLLEKLTGVAVRVPLLNASLTDCVFEVKRSTTMDEVNAVFKRAADITLQGILGYEERPLVSVGFKHDPRSAIVDAPSTMVVDGTCVKVLAWYDNEIGYVHRMIELAEKVGASL